MWDSQKQVIWLASLWPVTLDLQQEKVTGQRIIIVGETWEFQQEFMKNKTYVSARPSA